MPGIVDSVLVDDNGSDQSTELDQRVPVAAVARESRRLDREHGAYARFADRCQQTLEARPSDAAARAAQIIVDDLDCGPAELTGAIGKPVLPASALVIVRQLIGRRLSDVDVRAARKMLSRDLAHRRSPRLPALSRFREAGLPPELPDRPSVPPLTRRRAPCPRTGSAGAKLTFRLFHSTGADHLGCDGAEHGRRMHLSTGSISSGRNAIDCSCLPLPMVPAR
jgi:hypothetical protein